MVYLIYSFFFFLIGIVLSGSNLSKRKWTYYIYYMAIVLFWGLSYIYAPDTDPYIYVFKNNIQPIGGYVDTQFEVGYTFLAMTFKSITNHYWLFQFAVFAIELYLIIAGLRELIDDKSLVFIIPLLFFIFPLNLSAFRQGIAASIFIYSIHFIGNRNWRKSLWFFVCIGIAALFHQSSLFLAFVYLARYSKSLLSRKWLVIIILVFGDYMVLSGNTLASMLDFLFPFLGSGTLDMGEKYVGYIESADMNGTYGIAKLIEINIAVLLYLFFCFKYDNTNLLFFNMTMYASVGLIIGGFLAHRLNYYWILLYYVCFFQAVITVFKKYNLTQCAYLLISAYMLWLYIFKNGYIDFEYKFIFNI